MPKHFALFLVSSRLSQCAAKKGEDLIWGGSEQVSRAGHASVRAAFDNRDRLFDIDFDEVVLERAVHRDGINQYSINNSQVRLRDINELMATANIGSSGHHIISQGEVDRILSAHPRERREMIEDALGLRVYQYRLLESGRKLTKTKENIEQVQSLRREIIPHLKFLKRQVERIEKTLILRDELVGRYHDYLKREWLYIKYEEEQVKKKSEAPTKELEKLESELESTKEALNRMTQLKRNKARLSILRQSSVCLERKKTR